MALTVSTIISDVQTLIDDDSNPTFAKILRFLNRGRQTLARDCPWYEKEVSYSSSINTYQIALPSDANKVKSILFRDVDNETRVEPLAEREWQQLDQNMAGPIYQKYFEFNFTLNMYPRLQTPADIFTLSADIGLTDTALIAADLSKASSVGKIIAGTEVIYYNGKNQSAYLFTITSGVVSQGDVYSNNSQTFIVESGGTLTSLIATGTGNPTASGTLTFVSGSSTSATTLTFSAFSSVEILKGLVRGSEGTTAATHTAGILMTERDVVITYYGVPPDLTSGQVDQIFEVNPDVLVYFCAWQSKIRDTDDTNPSADRQMQYFKQEYMKAVAEMKYNIRSRKDGPMKVMEVV